MKKSMLCFINNAILSQAAKLEYIVKDIAPNTEKGLFNESTLIIWSGESNNTIYQDASVNYAFRALHDALHITTGLGFSHDHEIELGRIQASQYDSQLMQDLVYCEVALQAKYHQETGLFLKDQVSFTQNYLKGLGY
jgi:hypothetical protein